MQVAMLRSSIKENKEYEAVVAAVLTMDESKATWEAFTDNLIKEYKEKKLIEDGQGVSLKIKAALGKENNPKQKPNCSHCKKHRRTSDLRWDNTDGRNFKLNRKQKENENHNPRLAMAVKTNQEHMRANQAAVHY